MPGHFQTTQQKRSEAAMTAVQRFKQAHTGGKDQKSYRSRAREIPGMIRVNGLLQTLAFLYAKGNSDPGYSAIAEDTRGWLQKAINEGYLAGEPQSAADLPRLIQWLTSLEVSDYMAVTEEALSFLGWVKRFAEGMIDVQTGG